MRKRTFNPKRYSSALRKNFNLPVNNHAQMEENMKNLFTKQKVFGKGVR